MTKCVIHKSTIHSAYDRNMTISANTLCKSTKKNMNTEAIKWNVLK